MRSTYDWFSGSMTGIGLKKTDPLSFNEKVSYKMYVCFNNPSNNNKVTDNLSLEVKELCPYYFDHEGKFLEQAGIKPSATLDEIFHESDDDEVFKIEAHNGEDSEEGKKSNSDVVNDQDDSKDSESTKNQASVNGSKTNSHLLGSAKKSKEKPSVMRRKT